MDFFNQQEEPAKQQSVPQQQEDDFFGEESEPAQQQQVPQQQDSEDLFGDRAFPSEPTQAFGDTEPSQENNGHKQQQPLQAQDEDFFTQPQNGVKEEEKPNAITEWYKNNRKVLEEKEVKEQKQKQEIQQKASEYIQGYYQRRQAALEHKAQENRDLDQTNKAYTTPQGDNTWERVNSIMDFNFQGNTKDVSKFKSMLIQAKSRNIQDGQAQQA